MISSRINIQKDAFLYFIKVLSKSVIFGWEAENNEVYNIDIHNFKKFCLAYITQKKMDRWSILVKWKKEFFLGLILSNFNQWFRKDMNCYILSTDKNYCLKIENLWQLLQGLLEEKLVLYASSYSWSQVYFTSQIESNNFTKHYKTLLSCSGFLLIREMNLNLIYF